MGYEALLLNTTGGASTANGSAALISNTTGNQNTANGFNALQFNKIGAANTARSVEWQSVTARSFQYFADELACSRFCESSPSGHSLGAFKRKAHF